MEVMQKGARTDLFRRRAMRTTLQIDGQLLREAMRCSGNRTIQETVEEGLRLLIRINAQSGIRRLRGKIHLAGNLEEPLRE